MSQDQDSDQYPTLELEYWTNLTKTFLSYLNIPIANGNFVLRMRKYLTIFT
jgi:hypothetical protein